MRNDMQTYRADLMDAARRSVLDDLIRHQDNRKNQDVLSRAERGKYSLARAILHAGDPQQPRKSCMELELSDTIEASINRPLSTMHSFYAPLEILTRDVSVGASGGQYLVQTNVANPIEALRAQSVVERLGATVVRAGMGNETMPRMIAGAAGYWLTDETTIISESSPTLDQVSITPKHVGALIDRSRLHLKQSSPMVDQFLAADLGQGLAAARDQAALQGTGTGGQPTGIVNTSGIGTVTGASLGWSGLLEFESDVAGADALRNPVAFGYVTTPAVKKILAARERAAGSGMCWEGRTINSEPALTTTNCPGATMIGGDWSQLVIIEWGVMEITVDMFTQFTKAVVSIRAMLMCDIVLRNAASFSVATSIT